MSFLDIFDTPSPIPRDISTASITHLSIPEERLTFPELVHCYCIRSFVTDLQWANHNVPISRKECQAAWFAYLEREWNKYQDAEYEPPDDGVDAPSEEELLEHLNVMIAGAFKNNWRTEAERRASDALEESRRHYRAGATSINKSKTTLNKSKDGWKKRRQAATRMQELEIAIAQMNFESESSTSKTVAGQQREANPFVLEKSGSKVAVKKPGRPAKIVKQNVAPRRSSNLLVGLTMDACEISDNEVEALAQDREMDVDIDDSTM